MENIQTSDLVIVASFNDNVLLCVLKEDKDNEAAQAIQYDLAIGTYAIDHIQKFLKFTPFEDVDQDSEILQDFFRDLIYRKLTNDVLIDSLVAFTPEEDHSPIQKAYLSGLISEEVIEKSWKKHPIGTVVTRKDGNKWRKISETGNTEKDWEIEGGKGIKPDKESGKKAGKSVPKSPEIKKQPTAKELAEYAKNTSESALYNAIKGSSDEEIRNTAQKELDRREKEEKPSEGKENKSIYGNDKLSTLDIIEDLNKEYKGKVKFDITADKTDNSDYESVGISYASLMSDGSVEIYLNNEAYEKFEENEKMYGKSFEKYFKEVVESIIRHENVHRKYGENKVDPENKEKYLSEPAEMRAQAQSIVDEFRRKGYSEADILKKFNNLDSSDNDHLYQYINTFSAKDDVVKKVIGYAENLLNKAREEKPQEKKEDKSNKNK